VAIEFQGERDVQINRLADLKHLEAAALGLDPLVHINELIEINGFLLESMKAHAASLMTKQPSQLIWDLLQQIEDNAETADKQIWSNIRSFAEEHPLSDDPYSHSQIIDAMWARFVAVSEAIEHHVLGY
jgi:hypothetical protein